MTKEDILKLRDTEEQTRVQFKECVTCDNKYDVSCEMVVLSNSRGGMIVVGIDDKMGCIIPLSFVEVQETTNLGEFGIWHQRTLNKLIDNLKLSVIDNRGERD